MIRVVIGGLVAGAFTVSLVLPWFASTPGVAIGVWVIVGLAWRSQATPLDLASRYPVEGIQLAPASFSGGRGVSLIELVPIAFGLQFALDLLVPHLGSALVLFGNLAAITASVRCSPFPSARVVR